MAVPGSGTLTIQGLHNEKNEDNYDASTVPSGPATLKDLAEGGNSGGSTVSYEATNTTGDYEPNTSAPHGMDEWYNYDHDHDPSTATTPTISLSSADLNSLTLTWDMAGVNQRVYFILVSLWGSTLNAPLEVNGNTYKTSAGNTDLMQSGAPSTYNNGNSTIPASGYPNSTIVIKARAYYNGAYSDYSSNITGVTRPATPTSLAASSITTGGMTIGWTAPTNGANSYTYYFGTNSTATANSSASTTNTSVAITSLSPNTTYYFAVEAVGTGGTGAITSTVSQITQLGTPTNLHQDSNTNSQIVLDWDAPGGGATTYNVWFGTHATTYNGSGNNEITGIGSTTYTKTSLANNSTYYFYVQSVGTGTAPSSAVSSGQVVYTKPGVPTSLTQTSPTTSGMTLAWTAPTNNATNYTYYFGTDTDHDANPSATTSYTYFQKSSLDANTRYYWGVKSNGDGGSSTVVTADHYTKPNDPPTSGFGITSTTSTTITFGWSVPSPGGASQYKTYYATSQLGTGTLANTLTGTSDTINPYGGLTPNTQYWVRVLAVGPTGLESSIRAVNSSNLYENAYTKPGEPTSPTIGSVGTTQLTFSWTAPTGGANSYIYYFASATDFGNITNEDRTNADTDVVITTEKDGTALVAHTRYYMYVIAVGSGGNSIASTVVNSYTKVGVPTIDALTSVGDGQMTLNWTAPAGGNAPTGYQIRFGTNNSHFSNNTLIPNSSISGTSHQVTSLAAGTTYYWWIEALGNGPDSGYSSMQTAATLPGIPQNVSMGTPTTTSITLSWDAVTSATSYTYYFGTSASNALANPVTGHSSTSVTKSSLSPNTRYYAFVAAVNSGGSGTVSSTINIYTKVGTPTSPTVTLNAGTPDQAPLSWSAPAGTAPSSYYVRFGTYSGSPDHSNNNDTSPNNVGNVTSKTITSLTAGGLYYFWVKAIGNGADSDYTTRLDVQLLPGVATNITVTPDSSTQVTLSWTAGLAAVSYNYWFGTSSTYTNNTQANTTGTSVTKTSLSPNTRYYLKVQSVNAGGTTLASTHANAYTNPAAVSNVSVAGASASSVTVSFTEATGGGVATIRWSTSVYGTYTTGANNGGSGGSITQTGLDANKEYFIVIHNYGTNGSYASTSAGPNGRTFPDPPESLSLTNITNDDMTLNFSAPSDGGANSYIYYFGTNATGTSNTATAVSNTNSITKSGLASLTTHYFTVVAVGSSGNSVAATTISASTLVGTVTGGTVTATSPTTIDFEWDEMSAAYGYVVYVHYSGATGTPTVVTSITGASNNSHTITNVGGSNLSSNTRYYCGVKAIDNDGNQSSAMSAFATGYTTPGPVTNFVVSSITSTGAVISWTAPGGGDGGDYPAGTISNYQIYVGTNSGGYDAGSNASVGTTGTATYKTLSGLNGSSTYYVYIRTENNGGWSPYSTQSTFTATFSTLAPAPTMATHRRIGSGRSATWTSDTNGETIVSNGTTGNTANLLSSGWRVQSSGAGAQTTSTIAIPSGISDLYVKFHSSASGLGGASYQSSGGSVTNSSKQIYFRLKETITYMTGPSTVTRNVVVTNGTGSVTIPITWSYTGQVGASDRRLKTDIKKIGTSPSGIPIYEFRFKNDLEVLWEGTIAQDLLEMGMDEVVGTDEDGFYTVDYDKIDVDQIQVIEMDKK